MVSHNLLGKRWTQSSGGSFENEWPGVWKAFSFYFKSRPFLVFFLFGNPTIHFSIPCCLFPSDGWQGVPKPKSIISIKCFSVVINTFFLIYSCHSCGLALDRFCPYVIFGPCVVRFLWPLCRGDTGYMWNTAREKPMERRAASKRNENASERKAWSGGII